MTTRLVSLIGLGFGDCGKGLFTDYLTRHWNAHTVVRFNGGAQAGHNVVLADGRHHTFSQFGAGTLVPGVHTMLAQPVVVHPSALLVEEQALQRLGVADALTRLHIDARCRVNTPFHQAAGRLREWARGAHAHGSCGVGVGETVRHALEHPEQVLYYGDLVRPQRTRERLAALRHTLCAEFEPLASALNAAQRTEWELLNSPAVEARWLAQCQPLLAVCPPAPPEALHTRLHRPGTVVFEGAQGLLLDEWHGFHPHTSWSSITPQAAQAVASDLGCAGVMQHLGVVRSYLTRHGAGPLPTHDPGLDVLPEPHNSALGWQGAFRRGHPDAVLLRYAIDCAGLLQGLLVSHLDVFNTSPCLRWCEAYSCKHSTAVTRHTELPAGPAYNLAHQQALTTLLAQATPQYATQPLTTAQALIERLQAHTALPVWYGSHGPTHQHVQRLHAPSY